MTRRRVPLVRSLPVTDCPPVSDAQRRFLRQSGVWVPHMSRITTHPDGVVRVYRQDGREMEIETNGLVDLSRAYLGNHADDRTCPECGQVVKKLKGVGDG